MLKTKSVLTTDYMSSKMKIVEKGGTVYVSMCNSLKVKTAIRRQPVLKQVLFAYLSAGQCVI